MQLLIDGMTVTVIRKPIKNMNLRVLPPDGVIQITAPARLPQENIARFVREKRSWIERRQQILAARPAPTCPDFSDGQTVYLWGESRRLRLEPAARGRNAFLRDQDIVLQVHPGDTPAQRQALGLMQVAGIDLDYEVREEDGYLKFTLPPLSKERRRDADMILNTLYLGIFDLHEGFSDFIELEVK